MVEEVLKIEGKIKNGFYIKNIKSNKNKNQEKKGDT